MKDNAPLHLQGGATAEPCNEWRQMMHLHYCMYTAWDAKVDEHPQEVMRRLGVTYQHATPQSISDSWWFWNCEGIPDPLPPYIKELKIKNPHEYIGLGLSKEDADAIARQ